MCSIIVTLMNRNTKHGQRFFVPLRINDLSDCYQRSFILCRCFSSFWVPDVDFHIWRQPVSVPEQVVQRSATEVQEELAGWHSAHSCLRLKSHTPSQSNTVSESWCWVLGNDLTFCKGLEKIRTSAWQRPFQLKTKWCLSPVFVAVFVEVNTSALLDRSVHRLRTLLFFHQVW